MINLFRQLAGPQVDHITSAEAQELLSDAGTVFVDVREPYEYKSGHIPKAKNIPVGEIGNRLLEISKDKQVVVVCASGMRSQRAAGVLSNAGYTVKNMTGGMHAWRGKVS